MGSRERRDRQKTATRQAILDAARELFARDGYEAVSMRRIAEKAEYTPASLYLHFPDKESLLRACCLEDFSRFTEVIRGLRGVPDPVERIRQLGHLVVTFGVSHPNHYKLMFMTAHDVAPAEEALARKGDPDQDGYAFLREAVVEAHERKLWRPEYANVDLVCQTLWAAVHGVTALQIIKGHEQFVPWRPLADRAAAAINAALDGMLRPARKGGRP